MTSNDDWTNQAQNLVIVVGGNGGVFVYDPTPALGNLIASLTDASTDPFGNVTEKGVSAYVTDLNSLREAVNLNVSNVNGLAGLSIRDTAHPPFAPPGCYGQGSGSGGASKAVAFLDSGTVTNTDADAVVTAQSQAHSGVTGGVVNLLAGQMTLGNTSTLVVDDNTGGLILANPVATPPGAAGPQVFSSANGVPSILTAHGLSGQLPAVQADISTHGPGNTNTATDITKAWSIPASDAAAGTTYTIKALLLVTTGQTTIETLTIGCDIGGTKTALATLGTAFNGGALATTYAVPFELVMIVDAVSAGTPEVYLNAPLGDTSANRLATNSANLQGFTHAASFAPASGGTFAAYAQWGGAGGSQQLAQTISSRLYREGP